MNTNTSTQPAPSFAGDDTEREDEHGIFLASQKMTDDTLA